MESNNKRVWLIGGSSGIGLQLCKNLLANNYKVVVSSRNATTNVDTLKLKQKYNENLYLQNLDATSKENIKEKVSEAWNAFESLDIWFYNAGSYEVMDINSWDYDKFALMNSTNYLAVINIMTAIIPYFQKQKSGRWIWNLSLSTYFGLPKGGGYSAPKTALLNLAQSIHPELKQYNVDLQVINHGFVKTRLTSKNDFEMPQLMEPSYAAKKIFEAIEKNNSFEIRFPFKLRLFLQVLNYLPYKLSLAITKRMLNES